MIAPEPFFESRGTPFSVYYRCQAMSKFDCKIDLLTYHVGLDMPLKNVRHIRIPKIPFIKKVKIGPSGLKLFLDIFIFFSALKLMLTNKYDAIHCHEEGILFGVFFKLLFRTKLIYDMHSSLPDQLGNYNFIKNKFIISIAEKIEKKYLNYSDGLIAICPALKRKADFKLSKKKQIFVIENSPLSGQHGASNKKELTKIKVEYGLSGKKVITYTGSLGFQQGLELLVDSGTYLKKWFGNSIRILIVGGGDENYINLLKKRIKNRNLSELFIFAGYWPVDKMSYFEKLSDILVTPRLKGSNTPLKIYSYLRSGVPIVATRLETHTQVLNDKVSMLTIPKPEDFALGIKQLLKNKTLAKELVKNAIKLEKENYSFEIYLKKTKKFVDYIKKWKKNN